MKKYIIILFSMLLLAGNSVDAQINPIKRPQKAKSEKTQKQDKKKNKSQKQTPQTKTQKQKNSSRSQNERENDGSVYISISCSANDASLYIDGLYYGNISGLHEVSQGSHYVSIIANGFETYQDVIDVTPSKTTSN